MTREIDLSVMLNDATPSPPSTTMRLEITPRSPLHVFEEGITTAEIGLDQVMGERRGRGEEGDIVLLRTDRTDRMFEESCARLPAPFDEIAGTEGAPARCFATVD